jgi:hypothetical protein
MHFRQPVKDVLSMRTKKVDLQGIRRKQLLGLAKKAGIRRYRRLSKTRLAAALSSLPPPQPEVAPGPADLPVSYGRTRLILMDIEPFWVYAYWEVTPQDERQAARQTGMIGPAGQWILRFYDITGSEGSDPAGHDFFDLPVDVNAGSWYVNLWSGNKTYCAELGAVAAPANFIPVCRSNVIMVPPAAPLPGDESRWLEVQGCFEHIEPAGEPEDAKGTAPFHTEVRAEPVLQAAPAATSQFAETRGVMPGGNRPVAPLVVPVGAQAAPRLPETISSFGLGGSVADRRKQ